jgi:hypothetical protein
MPGYVVDVTLSYGLTGWFPLLVGHVHITWQGLKGEYGALLW